MNSEQFRTALTSNGYPAPSHSVYKEFEQIQGDFAREELAMFLAQLIHESGGFQFIEEIAYAGRGWHNEYRDGHSLSGKLYHGRGYIQLTWAANYLAASRALGLGDLLLREPELVSQRKDLAMGVSVWYWKDRVRPALRERPNCFGVTTKAINGALECGPYGDHGRARKRYSIYQNVARAMGIRHLASEGGCYN